MVSVLLRQKERTLTMAAKFKDSHIKDFLPHGIIYGLKNKVFAKYLGNPLERATEALDLSYLTCGKIIFLRDARIALWK